DNLAGALQRALASTVTNDTFAHSPPNTLLHRRAQTRSTPGRLRPRSSPATGAANFSAGHKKNEDDDRPKDKTASEDERRTSPMTPRAMDGMILLGWFQWIQTRHSSPQTPRNSGSW